MKNLILTKFCGMGQVEFSWLHPIDFQKYMDNSGEFGIAVYRATTEEIAKFGATAKRPLLTLWTDEEKSAMEKLA